MSINFLVVLLSAIVPMAVGFVWYHPKVMGNAWMQASGMTEDKIKGANMAVIFGVAFLFSIVLATSVQFLVIHQVHINSLFVGTDTSDPASEMGALYKTIFDKLGGNYRTFKHGLFHGIISGVFIALPVLGTNALFERKGFKYIAINAGYWIISLGLMGGIVCGFA